MKAREELLREIGILKRDAEYWETQAKTLRIRNEQLLDDINILYAKINIWKGTGL